MKPRAKISKAPGSNRFLVSIPLPDIRHGDVTVDEGAAEHAAQLALDEHLGTIYAWRTHVEISPTGTHYLVWFEPNFAPTPRLNKKGYPTTS